MYKSLTIPASVLLEGMAAIHFVRPSRGENKISLILEHNLAMCAFWMERNKDPRQTPWRPKIEMANVYEGPYGTAYCSKCHQVLICEENGDMPEFCPGCKRYLLWSSYDFCSQEETA